MRRCVLLCLLLFAVPALGQVTFTMRDTLVLRGTVARVPIVIDVPDSEAVFAIDAQVVYDSRVLNVTLEPVDRVLGGAVQSPQQWTPESWMFAVNVLHGAEMDTILLAAATLYDTLQTGDTLCVVQFAIPDTTRPVQSAVHVSVMLHEGEIPSSSNGGTITIVGSSATLVATERFQARPSRHGWRDTLRVGITDDDVAAPVAEIAGRLDVERTASGIVPFTTEPTEPMDGLLTVDATQEDPLYVTYVDSLTGTGETVTLERTAYAVPVFGDITGDGRVTAYDVWLTFLGDLGFVPVTPERLRAGDTDGDGLLNAEDGYRMLYLQVGLADHYDPEP